MKTVMNAMAMCLLSVMVMGCARDIGGASYNESTVGEASNTYVGTIVNVRNVKVAPDQLSDNKMGTGIGAAAGGLAGSHLGKGTGRLFGALGGAVAGGVAGAYAEQELRTQMAQEYVVRLDSGRMLTLVQTGAVYQPGQRVYLTSSYRGKSRIIGPANY